MGDTWKDDDTKEEKARRTEYHAFLDEKADLLRLTIGEGIGKGAHQCYWRAVHSSGPTETHFKPTALLVATCPHLLDYAPLIRMSSLVVPSPLPRISLTVALKLRVTVPEAQA